MILLNMECHRIESLSMEACDEKLKLRFYARETQLSLYQEELKAMENLTKEEYVIILRRYDLGNAKLRTSGLKP